MGTTRPQDSDSLRRQRAPAPAPRPTTQAAAPTTYPAAPGAATPGPAEPAVAQVNGFRGGTPQLELMQQRIQHDLWYIDNWSLPLDLRIIIKTVFEVFRRNNAY